MAKSQNGWKAGPKTEIKIVNPYIKGTRIKMPQGVLAGDVEIILMYVAEQFHKTVEPVKAGHCWGYFYKNIEGSKSLSNHASGTAIDINAVDHPMGKRGTFSAKKVKAIRKILAFLEGVVRWGGDYVNRPDDMHWEIVGNAKQVKRVADKIRELSAPKPTPAPAPAKPTPAKPTPLKVDGDLGPATIRRWQKVMGTEQDGKISDPSELIKAVQKHLNAKLKAKLTVDGKLGPKTESAIQRYLGVKPDGSLGSTSIRKLQERLNTGKF